MFASTYWWNIAFAANVILLKHPKFCFLPSKRTCGVIFFLGGQNSKKGQLGAQASHVYAGSGKRLHPKG